MNNHTEYDSSAKNATNCFKNTSHMKSVKVKLDGPVMSLELNRENTKVAVAGRRAFKLFAIEEGQLIEEANLRGTDTVNLNYSFNDVTWNLKDENMLATAATNGAIVTWNLNKSTHSKQEHVYLDHKRTVNRISFHSAEPWLLSGSQDGTVRLFDLRVREAGQVFKSKTESIRDVKFSPLMINHFAAVSENGRVQLWDIRRQDKFFVQFTAHSEPIFSCDWNLESPWLATASRDKSIKVWDVTPAKPIMKYAIYTIASVGRVKWRPHRRYQLASTAIVVDCGVNVWDVRRPYIPFAYFKSHSDIATDIVWKHDPYVILSTGRDSQVIHHVFSDGLRPANCINPQVLNISCMGEVVFADKVNNLQTKPSKFQVLSRKPLDMNEEFFPVSSYIQLFGNITSDWLENDVDMFIKFASGYILIGKSLNEICEHNSQVAKSLGKMNISLLWNVIGQIFTESYNDANEYVWKNDRDNSIINDLVRDDMDMLFTTLPQDVDYNADEFTQSIPFNIKQQSEQLFVGDTCGDFIFGDKDMDPFSFDCDICENPCYDVNRVFADKLDFDENNWCLPHEAFAVRHEIEETFLPAGLVSKSHVSLINEESNASSRATVDCRPTGLTGLSTNWTPMPPHWEPSKLIADALLYYADRGDFQTAACILLILGDKRRHLTKCSLLDETVQEQWLFSYLGILNRYKLWNITTQVIRLSWIGNVSQLNQLSTTMRTFCGKCRRVLIRSGWICDRCNTRAISKCAVCHKIVKGIYIWCQGCSHGGHINHITSWFQNNSSCPAACGHLCEYQ